MKTIKVENCRDCPFVNYDGDYEYNGCNLIHISLDEWEQMPSDKVHEQCPLKIDSSLVELK